MKILHTVQLYYPSIGGMQEVVMQISERLVALGHEVCVATMKLPNRGNLTINGVKVVEFDVAGNLVHGMTGEVDAYRKFVIQGGFDVVVNFAAQQWATDAIISELQYLNIPKVFVPTGFSGLHDPLYEKYFESMRNWMKQYDMNIFLSNDYRDINFARENSVENILIIPNGASEKEFMASGRTGCDLKRRLGIPENDFLIMTVGSHTGLKGHSEAIKLFSEASITDSTFLIIANETGGGCSKSCKRRESFFNKWFLNRRRRKKVIVSELSREDTILAYMNADLFLFTSNIECSPLVLFEAMASRTPFLTVDVGNAVEIIEWANGGVLLPTNIDKKGYSRVNVKKGGEMLKELVLDEEGRNRLGESGFDSWRNRFTWGLITLKYEKLYKDLLANKSADDVLKCQ